MTTTPGPGPTPGAGASTAPRRHRSWLRWLLLALLLLPFAEIAVLILVGRTIGIWWTLGLLVAVAVVGAWLARRETGRTYRALDQALRSGRMPGNEVTDAILVMLGGFLLVLPGFLSDVVGLFLVLPFTRPLARRMLQALVVSRTVAVVGGPEGRVGRPRTGAGQRGRTGGGEVIEGEVVAEEAPPWQRSDDPPRLEG